ncbi:MAG TPA: acyltransferase [Noviherbaspirillum sp.]|jgi:peptidoglycan/LPS O-acetylase OafA/YrhL|uniref:acyltransferase family protein n=1 Tax=Noviherbaspirillum sp. TaxID=1926288 RepID=UPI002F92E36E
MDNRRILGFDFLRGLCALGIAFYHVLGWLKLYHANNIGLYCVYIFFILSGASIYIAYADRFKAGHDIKKFMYLRLFRLVPLFAIVVLATPFITYFDFTQYDFAFAKKALINSTFAFGLGDPGTTSIPTGGWSLGIEFVFYLMFPTILAFVSGRLSTALTFTAIVAVLQYSYISLQVSPAGGFLDWPGYTQFLSFPLYFVAGCLIGRLLTTEARAPIDHPLAQVGLWAAFIGLCAFMLLTDGTADGSGLIGKRRLVLPLVSIALVVVSAYMKFPTKALSSLAVALGNMSYGLYLIHPLIYVSVMNEMRLGFGQDKEVFVTLRDWMLLGYHSYTVLFAVAIVSITVLIALIIERLYERPLNQLGKRLVSGKRAAQRSSSRLPEVAAHA